MKCFFANFRHNFKSTIQEKHMFNSPIQPLTHCLMQSNEILSRSSELLEKDILNDAIVSKSGKIEGGVKLLIMSVIHKIVYIFICLKKCTFAHSKLVNFIKR